MSNILVADAGSSKTNWSLLMEESDIPLRVSTSGINPAHQNPLAISEIILEVKNSLPQCQINEIYFFGAGCASRYLKTIVEKCLAEIFDADRIVVESDLLGAAIALFEDGKGVAAILGTGSNTGYYSEGKIVRQIPSLGYILGDEGAGVSLGKALLNGIFKQTLPKNIIEEFHHEYSLSVEDLIHKVYKEPKPAAFIASFTPFIMNHMKCEEIKVLAEERFKEFFKKNVLPYGYNLLTNIGMVGSIAYHFQEQVRHAAAYFDLNLSNILKEPMPSLEKYFRS